MPRLVAACIALLLMFADVTCAAARTDPGFTHEIGGDRFAAGSDVEFGQPVAGDAAAAGSTVSLSSSVAGDVLLAARNLIVDGEVGENLYAAGRDVVVNAAVGRNARIAAESVDIGPRAHIAGNASLAGRHVNVSGSVNGYLQAAGSRIYIDGPVGGDVEASGREVVLGPNARIAGALRYRSPNLLEQHPEAVVSGGIEHVPTQRPAAPPRPLHRAGHWIWTIGLMVLAASIVAALPRFSSRVSGTLGQRFLSSLVLAFAVIVCTPVAAIVLFITGIGAPLAILAVLAYPALLLVGYVSAGIALGDALLRRLRPAAAANAMRNRSRIVFAALAMLVLSLARSIPWIGGFIAVVAFLAGVGALVLQGWAMASGCKAEDTV